MTKGNPHNGSIYRRKAKAARESGDVCWLCLEPIDHRLKWPHPMSAAADHVDPLKTGGALLGEMRPSHKVCNERRQAGRSMEEITKIPPPGTRKPLTNREW